MKRYGMFMLFLISTGMLIIFLSHNMNVLLFLLVLAVGYSTGKINLCDVENSSCLQSVQLPSKVTCLLWTSDIAVDCDLSKDGNNCFQDLSDQYLPKLPLFAKRLGFN